MTVHRMSLRSIAAAIAFLLLGATALRAEIAARPGWVVQPTAHSYTALAGRVQSAAKANGLGIVSRASATVGAKALLGMEIAGNMVIGLYHPSFAVRMLDASVAAGIEAPIRMYVTENTDGTATLSYKMPSNVFAPYMDEGGEALKTLALELDTVFDTVAKQAAGQ